MVAELEVIKPLYAIWSEEHLMWWNPHEAGYTRSLAKAGLYSKARAFAICDSANFKSFHEIAIEITPAMAKIIRREGQ